MKISMKNIALSGILGFLTFSISTAALAGAKDQAYRIFNKLNGIPPDAETLSAMTKLIEASEYRKAALKAIDDPGGNFYRLLLDYVATWTNEDLYVRYPLNDYSATILGLVRDEVPFDQALHGDVVYIGVSPDSENPLSDYSLGGINDDNNGNQHYLDIQDRNLPLHKVLAKRKQSELSFLTSDAASGVFTTRGFASTYYNAGTNRSAVRFALMTYICRDMEELTDSSRPDNYVRRDVERAPGGDPSQYKSKCVGCHAGMDGLGGAFAYLDYTDDNGFTYNPIRPVPKYSQNAAEFPSGHETKDDSWVNLWATKGPNASLGWNGAQKGKGIKSWGKMLSETDAFPVCMAQRALVMICNVDPEKEKVKVAINQMANSFKANDRYNMKQLFVSAALYCRGK